MARARKPAPAIEVTTDLFGIVILSNKTRCWVRYEDIDELILLLREAARRDPATAGGG